jgi:NADPH-dependent curcumin reductase CurA
MSRMRADLEVPHMSPPNNRWYRLRRRPRGVVSDDDLELVVGPIPRIEPGQALIRTLWLSIDPAARIWMSDVRYGAPPVPIGGVMRGFGVGEVVDSRRGDLTPGDLVLGTTGWSEYVVAGAQDGDRRFRVLPSSSAVSPSVWLGALGYPGITAYLGVVDIGKPRPGETMFVSAAAGAVGSVAGQIGKARGARVVGTAGGPEKCRHVVERLGFDACIDYKDRGWRARLDAVTPDGIDVDFENVGGPVMQHVVGRLNVGGRLVLCGLMSQYDALGSQGDAHAQLDVRQILVKRALVQSFLVLDHADRFGEATEYLSELLREGKLAYEETVVDGLERAPEALRSMFEGANTGKLLVKVAEPAT